MRYYLIAGERSGDLHGGNLLRSLSKHDPDLVAQGFGGDSMKDAGMAVTVHYDQLAIMGLTAVVQSLGSIARLLKVCREDIASFKPDVIILIDFGGFNMRMARYARTLGIRVYYYISPKVWAWNTGRAWKLKRLVSRMFCILPFEKEFYKKFDWDVDYVGNPVMDAVKAFRGDTNFRKSKGLEAGKKIVAFLPGSRAIELKRVIPAMAAVARRKSEYQFVVAAVRTLPEELYRPLRDIPSVKFVFESTYDLLAVSDAAVVTSGTATLETALFRVPQAVVYKASTIEATLFRLFSKVSFISLPNLIAGKEAVKELFLKGFSEEGISHELEQLLEDKQYRGAMLSEYDRILKILDQGSASENAARLMVSYLKNDK